jgi:predicted short-subunit dehydrogenase-like oxidoreductase (DUF2520 family)
MIVHTSGNVGIDIFENTRFDHYGIFYPLQTFSKGREIDFKEIPFILEASDDDTLNSLKGLVNEFGASYYQLSSIEKQKLHLAAVFVSNYTNYLRQLPKTKFLRNIINY